MAKKPLRGRTPAPGVGNVCLECGAPIKSKTATGRAVHFCSTAHRKTWNNRRMTRGAVLYDLAMRWRYERDDNKDAINTMAQVASMFKAADDRLRNGRRSWINDKDRDVLTVASEAVFNEGRSLKEQKEAA